MDDVEKVIKGLECCAGQCNYHGCPYKDPCENANGVKQIMLDAIALLKEQEALEPNRGLAKTQTAWFCGACGFRLNRAGRFCSKCGRSVKWE